MKNNTLTIALLIGLGSMPSAHAVDKDWYIAPFGSFVNTAGDRNAADGFGGGLGFGKIINEHLNVELRGFYQAFGGYRRSDSRYIGDWELGGFTVDGQYFFNRNRFAPYAVVGLGGMKNKFIAYEATGFIAEFGAGFTYEVNRNFLLRSDIRYRYNNNPNVQSGVSEFNDMVINAGFVIPFNIYR